MQIAKEGDVSKKRIKREKMGNSKRRLKDKQTKVYRLEPSLPELANWIDKDESLRKIKYFHKE